MNIYAKFGKNLWGIEATFALPRWGGGAPLKPFVVNSYRMFTV